MTPAIRQYVRYYACEYGGLLGWRNDKVVGESRLGDSHEIEDGELLVGTDGRVVVRTVLYLVHPTAQSAPFFNHTLTIEQRGQRWVIVGDRLQIRPTTFALADQAASEPPQPPADPVTPLGATADVAGPDGSPGPECELPPEDLLSPKT